MISSTYRCLTGLGAPAIHYYLRRRLKAGREDASRFGERMGQASKPRPDGFLIWCHAASVGEAMSLLSLLDVLREHYPMARILLTTGTMTSARLMENRLPSDVFHQFIPVDRLPYVRSFLDHWRPDLVLWVESELWPNMLATIKERKIPAILLNGRMTEKSFRAWSYAKGWAKEILSAFDLCLTQTETYRERYAALGANPVRCVGNLKYTAQPLPFDSNSLETLRSATTGRIIWLMSSTHRGEESIAADLHKKLKNTIPNLLTILVPRHAVRGDEIAQMLVSSGLAVTRRSKAETMTPSTDMYLADTMGELGLFYRLANIVVMGNSFVSNGGHNPVEPALLAGALVFGPHMFSFEEITREFLSRQAAIQLKNADELAPTVERLINNPEECAILKANALKLAEDKRHVLHDVLRELEPWLAKVPQP